MVRWTRWALGLSCVAALGSAVWSYSISPEIVAIHYGLDGKPDGWGSPLDLLIVHECMIGFCTATALVMPVLVRRSPAWMINIPNKGYWLAPENRAAASAKLTTWADLFGTVFNLLMIPQLLMPGDTSATMGVAILFLGLHAFMIGSLIWLWRAFRLPAGTR